MEIKRIKSMLNSGEPNQMYDVLIDIGKNQLYEYEEQVEGFLKHDDPEVRRASIMVLSTYWSRQYFIEIAEDIWKNDLDELVQVTALISWFAYFAKSKNLEVIAKLTAVLRNDEADTDVRKEALRGIYIVLDLEVPQKSIDQLDFVFDASEFNELVNWQEIDKTGMRWQEQDSRY